MKTIILLSSTHFLHNKSKKLKQKKAKKKVKIFLFFCVSLLQVTQSMKEIVKVLFNVLNVLNQRETNSSFMKSIVELQFGCSNRNLKWLDDKIKNNEKLYQTKADVSENQDSLYILPDSRNLKKESKFGFFFEKIINIWEINLSKTRKKSKYQIYK